jgi:hypothetical protein
VEALEMGGLGGPEGTLSDRVSVSRYSEGRVLGLWAARNKTMRRESRVGLSHSRQYSARGSGSGHTYALFS